MPVHLALVDLCCSEETLELTRSALQASCCIVAAA